MAYPYQPATVPNWQPPMYQPSTYQYPQQAFYQGQRAQNTTSNLLKVTGPESAKAYPVGPNSTVALFDAEKPVFYLKTTDDSGFASIREFSFEEVQHEGESHAEGGVSKDDFDALKLELAEIRKMMEGLM